MYTITMYKRSTPPIKMKKYLSKGNLCKNTKSMNWGENFHKFIGLSKSWDSKFKNVARIWRFLFQKPNSLNFNHLFRTLIPLLWRLVLKFYTPRNNKCTLKSALICDWLQKNEGFIKTTDHRPTDPPTTYHLPTDPATSYY